MTIELRLNQGHLEARGVTSEERDHLVTLRDLWEERAAILEFDAGFIRAEAESMALAELVPTFWKEAQMRPAS